MDKLQQELLRLHLPLPAAGPDQHAGAAGRADGQTPAPGMVRTMVLQLATQADGAALSAVWAGVQSDLDLPAPAIAVNGRDGCQLWFALLAPVPAAQAGAFLDALRRRYLGEFLPASVALWPGLSDASEEPPAWVRPVPALQADTGLWSAFVAPDLVPMFADEPWLDLPPSPDGQARLLAPLKAMRPAQFELAWQRLVADQGPDTAQQAAPVAPMAAVDASVPMANSSDPRRFLLDVMNNPGVDLALRIEAAKALLPSNP